MRILNIRDKVVVGIEVSWNYISKTTIYGILYILVIILIGSYFIQKREI
jgi:hypothetical protein